MTELGDFLRSRRAQLTPEDVGLSRYGERRRVPGLRREEIAQLAGVSVTYYTRLEQGQSRNASDAVLDALARVLRLTDEETAYLHGLTRPAAARRASRPEHVRPSIRLLLDELRNSPALVIGRRNDVLAWNRLGHALLCSHLPADAPQRCHGRPNLAREFVLEAHARDLFVDWRRKVDDVVAYLRLSSGMHPDDTKLNALIGELCVKSELFATLWARHPVRDCTNTVREFRHPLVGRLTLFEEVMRLPDAGQRIVVMTAEPGSASAENLQLLASLDLTAAAPGPQRLPADPAPGGGPGTGGSAPRGGRREPVAARPAR